MIALNMIAFSSSFATSPLSLAPGYSSSSLTKQWLPRGNASAFTRRSAPTFLYKRTPWLRVSRSPAAPNNGYSPSPKRFLSRLSNLLRLRKLQSLRRLLLTTTPSLPLERREKVPAIRSRYVFSALLTIPRVLMPQHRQISNSGFSITRGSSPMKS